MISLLVHLSEVLHRIVNEVLLLLGFTHMEVQVLKVSFHIVFAFMIYIWLINQSESLDHDGKTSIQTVILHLFEPPSERIQNLDSSLTEIGNCHGNEYVLLQVRENSDPLVGLLLQKFIFGRGCVDSTSCFEHLQMRPV